MKALSDITASGFAGGVSAFAASGGGSGDLVGPASAADNALARFDGTSGKLVQSSGATLSDTGDLTATTFAATGTGSFSAPAIAVGTADTGLYYSGGAFAFTQNGTLRAYFDNSGRLVLPGCTLWVSAGGGLFDGLVESTVGGFKFPDDTVQTTAVTQYTDELAQDVVGAMVTAAGGAYDDGAGTITLPGGGGSPGGASGELQYNNAGAFAGAANVEVESGNLKLVSTSDPAAPTGGLLLYSKLVAGRHLPKIIGPSGIDTVMQVGLHGNSVFMVAPASGTTAPGAWGGTLTTAATMSAQQTIASANPWQATWRKRFATSGTAGNGSGMRTAYVQWFRGNAAGFGGFFFRAQLGQNINLNGAQCFVGLCVSTAALAATAGAVAALINSIGMGYDTTYSSAGNWQLFRNDGSGTATKVDLGANAARNTTHGFDLIIYCPPGAATEIFVRVVNIHTGTVVLDTSYTTDLPAVNTGLAFKAECNNGAVASATNLEVAKVYIESDY